LVNTIFVANSQGSRLIALYRSKYSSVVGIKTKGRLLGPSNHFIFLATFLAAFFATFLATAFFFIPFIRVLLSIELPCEIDGPDDDVQRPASSGSHIIEPNELVVRRCQIAQN
jgi:hypothetical protein